MKFEDLVDRRCCDVGRVVAAGGAAGEQNE